MCKILTRFGECFVISDLSILTEEMALVKAQMQEKAIGLRNGIENEFKLYDYSNELYDTNAQNFQNNIFSSIEFLKDPVFYYDIVDMIKLLGEVLTERDNLLSMEKKLVERMNAYNKKVRAADCRSSSWATCCETAPARRSTRWRRRRSVCSAWCRAR